jgi:uncharacterized membrane protein (UPF0127 family)
MIKNKTKQTIITDEKDFANTHNKRAKGLMFTLPIKNKGLIFDFPKKTLAMLHMLFVFYPIDILWLDENKKVVDIRFCALPFWPLIIPKRKSKYVIELPVKTIKKSKTQIGDKIEF